MKAPDNLSPDHLASAIRGSGSHKSSWLWWTLILLVIAGGAGGWWWWDQNEKARNAAPAFGTEPIQRGDIKLVVTATGNLEPTNQVTIGSELSGTTQEVFVDTNDKVTKGQPLAKIDVRRLSAQIDSSRATLNSAKAKISQIEATLKENEANLARQEELLKISGGKTPSEAVMVATRATVDRARADVTAAKAAAQQTEADVRANESDLAKSTIRSPIDGIVLKRTLEPGQTVAASFTAPELFIIAENLEHMKLKVAVAEADIGRLAAGQKASFTVDAWPDRTYNAKVTKVTFGSVIKENVVTYETELEVTNDDLSLRPGMTATADISVAESKEVLLVPSAALRFDPNAAAAALGGPGAQKSSFVQTLMPRGPRRSNSKGPPKPDKDKKAEKVIPGGRAHVWVLRNGKPEELQIITGLSDGRHVEVSGEDVTEGLPVIIRIGSPTMSTAAPMPLVRLHDLTKTYGRGDAAFQALRGIDLTIQRGEFVAIMGPSGSGKSTLMNLLGCLDTPTSGHYLYNNIAVETLNADQRSLLRRYALGFIFQGFNLLARTSALENVELPLLYRGISQKQRHQQAAAALASVGLPDKMRNTPAELSGGQQQRVAIARAIVTHPSTLFADEPTGNLDTTTTHEIMELLTRLNEDRGITIIMVTHEDEVASFAKRTVRVKDGLIESDISRK